MIGIGGVCMVLIENIIIENIQQRDETYPSFKVKLFLEKNKIAEITFYLYFYNQKENGDIILQYTMKEKIDVEGMDMIEKSKLLAQFYKRIQKDEKMRNEIDQRKEKLNDYAEKIVRIKNGK